ncbi:hypothetical protein ACFE04_009458 [Oxalis oulophora]
MGCSRFLLAYLLLLCLLLSQAQGIRLDKWFKSITQRDLQENEKSVLIEIEPKKATLCKEEPCSSSLISGKSRKLINVNTSQTSSTSTSSKISKNDHKNEEIKAKNPSSTNKGGEQEEKFAKENAENYAEIAEMDYSPARRKTPIHN